jgi:hypothetical protein
MGFFSAYKQREEEKDGIFLCIQTARGRKKLAGFFSAKTVTY